jgi:hypothetical protein
LDTIYDLSFIKSLIESRYGSVDELVVEWEERVRTEQQKIGTYKDRATLYRWLKNGLPAKRDDIFGLFGLLNVDPVACLNLESDDFRNQFVKERYFFLLNSIKHSRLAPLWSLIQANAHWPDQSISYDFFNRAWFAHEFTHTASAVRNAFVDIKLSTRERKSDMPVPFVYHFAYRKRYAADGLWRPFGCVIHYNTKAILISENGEVKSMNCAPADQLIVQTFFGPGPAEFKVASLHEFKLTVTAPAEEERLLQFSA